MPHIAVRPRAARGEASRAPVVATLYYVVAGVAAGGLAILNGLGPLSAATSGCQFVFSQNAPQLRADPPAAAFRCLQYIDAPNIVLNFAVATILLIAAWQLTRAVPEWGARVAMGVVVGVVVAFAPAQFILWGTGFYRLSLGPVELGVAVLPLAWAIVSGVLVWRTAHAHGQQAIARA